MKKKKNITSIVLLIGVTIVIVFAVVEIGRLTKPYLPVIVSRSDETFEVKITVYRHDEVPLVFPASEYTSKFSITLGDEFSTNIGDSSWYENLQQELQGIYEAERGIGESKYLLYQIPSRPPESTSAPNDEVSPKEYWLKEVPNIEWLREYTEIRPMVSEVFVIFTTLPIEGSLRPVLGGEDFENELDFLKSRGTSRSEIYEYQIRLAPSVWHTGYSQIAHNLLWDSLNDGNEYFYERLDVIQDAYEGRLLYSFEDGRRYLLIDLTDVLLVINSQAPTLGKQTHYAFESSILER